MKSSQGTRILPFALVITGMVSIAFAGDSDSDSDSDGLNRQARAELSAAGVDKYLGQFAPVLSTEVGDGWVKHTFDPSFGDGPICIAGTPYSVFTRSPGAGEDSDGDSDSGSDSDSDSDSDKERKAKELLVFLQGGGACWQDFYNCNVLAEAQEPPAPRVGIWDFDSSDNPFRKHSIVYMPYCDGSVFSGDNDVIDFAWQAFIENALGLPPGTGPLIRFHRGLRNQSAGMDLAKAIFPNAKRITVAGSSAGGVGAAGFSPFLVRFAYGNKVKLTVFNDAGPVTINLSATSDIADRAADWQFGQFYPASCAGCDPLGQGGTAVIDWRLDNDSTIREAFYETDGDLTNRFFLDLLFDPAGFRNLVVSEHGFLNVDHPDRYKRFIVAGDTSHTALQSPLFYIQDADGVLLSEWTDNFLRRKKAWVDIVEDPVP